MTGLEWCEDAGAVLGRGLLAGSLIGGSLGLVLGTMFASPIPFPFGSVFGLIVGAVAGVLPALVAAPALAIVHASVTTELGARGSAALASVLAMEVWALVLGSDRSTHLAWGLTGALVGVVVGPWVVFGPKPERTGLQDRR